MMEPQIRGILYATDFSKTSVYAFQYAMLFARVHDAPVTIVHIQPTMDPVGEIPVIAHLGEEQYRKLVEEKRDEILQMMKRKVEEFVDKNLQEYPEAKKWVASIQVIDGDASAVILGMADNEDCDLVVLGSHGKEVFRHTFLGSVAQRVLRHSRTPVVVVPIPEGGIGDVDWWQ
jgi:nucleotide-binding universal stress UspA family protein